MLKEFPFQYSKPARRGYDNPDSTQTTTQTNDYKMLNIDYPKSVISVMMIIAFVFEQMFCHFEGAMGFHCNREVTKQITKRRFH